MREILAWRVMESGSPRNVRMTKSTSETRELLQGTRLSSMFARESRQVASLCHLCIPLKMFVEVLSKKEKVVVEMVKSQDVDDCFGNE